MNHTRIKTIGGRLIPTLLQIIVCFKMVALKDYVRDFEYEAFKRIQKLQGIFTVGLYNSSR